MIKRYWWAVAGSVVILLILLLVLFRYQSVPNVYGGMYRVDRWTGRSTYCGGSCDAP